MADNLLTYKNKLTRLSWNDLEQHINHIYDKLEVFQERNDYKNEERMIKCLEYAEEEQNSRLTNL